MNKKAKVILILAVVAIFSITTLAFAGQHRRYGNMMGPDGRGSGWHHNDRSWSDRGEYYGNLSETEIASLDQQRAEFFKATEEIRQQLYEKELALRSELAKEDSDTKMASNLQGEISQLQSDLDQMRLDHEIQARKTVPNYNRSYRGYGSMMGYGHRNGGHCMW